MHGGILGVIIGAVLVLAACEKPRAEMAFHELDPDFGGLQGGKTVRVVGQKVRLDIGYAVYFGQLRSAQVSIQSEKALLAVTPRRTTPGPGGCHHPRGQRVGVRDQAGLQVHQPRGPPLGRIRGALALTARHRLHHPRRDRAQADTRPTGMPTQRRTDRSAYTAHRVALGAHDCRNQTTRDTTIAAGVGGTSRRR